MIVCWSVKGGSGTTVVASTLALVHAEKSPRGALIVDLAGDVPAVLGLAEPSGIGIGEWFAQNENSSRMALQSIAIQATANLQLISRGSGQIVANANFAELAASLATFDLPVVVDAGCGVVSPELLARASSSLLITRPCYLSLRRAAQLNDCRACWQNNFQSQHEPRRTCERQSGFIAPTRRILQRRDSARSHGQRWL